MQHPVMNDPTYHSCLITLISIKLISITWSFNDQGLDEATARAKKANKHKHDPRTVDGETLIYHLQTVLMH